MAEQLEMPQRTYAAYEKGRFPPLERLERLAELGLDVHWLATGEGSMLKSETGTPMRPEDQYMTLKVRHSKDGTLVIGHGTDEMIFVDVCDIQLSAGAGGAADQIDTIGKMTLSKTIVKELNVEKPKNLFIAQIHGDSMLPVLHDRDWVLLEHFYVRDWKEAFRGDDVYLVRISGDIMVKRVQRLPKLIRVISENKSYPAIEMNDEQAEADQFAILGRVVRRITRM
jgi:phage repressor protein C with HTH and peptisase S24 domain